MTIHNVSPNASQAQAHFRPKPDGASDPAGEAGWYLQREREMRGLSLDKVGQDTGVHPHHLEAIEMGDLSRLPERNQALNMIGAYARYLGFDPQPLMSHYARMLRNAQDADDGRIRPFSSARIIAFPLIERLRSATSGAGGVVASVLAAIMLFGGAVWVLTPGEKTSGEKWVEIAAEDPVAEPGAGNVADSENGVRTVSSISRLAERVLGDDSPAIGVNSMEALIARTVPNAANGDGAPKPVFRKDAAKSRKVAPGSAKITDRIATSAPAASTAKNGVATGFVLRARDDIWVRIEDREGNTLFSGMMKKGDTYTVPSREGLTIIARDGGLLEWSLDGRDMGRLSEPGKVLVGEPLDVGALMKRKG